MTTVTRDDYVPLAMTAHTWVAADKPNASIPALIARLKREAGSSTIKKHGWIIYMVHPRFEVSEIDGTIYTPAGHPAVKIEDKRRVEGVKTNG